MTGRDGFFGSKATIFVGERAGAEDAAAKVAESLACAGLVFRRIPCLQHERLQVYHRGSLYNTQRDIDGFAEYAMKLRTEYRATARPPGPKVSASTHGRLELRGQGHAVAALPPLVGRRFRLATRDGLLAFGNWWLGSLDAGTFELASEFGLAPPIGAAPKYGFREAPPEYDHVIIEVWPTDGGGRRMDCVRGRPHTTMVHVPFGHDIALHLIDADAMAGAAARTDDNLRGVFG